MGRKKASVKRGTAVKDCVQSVRNWGQAFLQRNLIQDLIGRKQLSNKLTIFVVSKFIGRFYWERRDEVIIRLELRRPGELNRWHSSIFGRLPFPKTPVFASMKVIKAPKNKKTMSPLSPSPTNLLITNAKQEQFAQLRTNSNVERGSIGWLSRWRVFGIAFLFFGSLQQGLDTGFRCIIAFDVLARHHVSVRTQDLIWFSLARPSFCRYLSCT